MPVIPNLSHLYKNAHVDTLKARRASALAPNEVLRHHPMAEIDAPDLIYSGFVHEAKTQGGEFNIHNPLGTIDETIDVAVIGAGISGLIAAFELSKIDKVRTVDIYEATDVVGGRCQPFRLNDGDNLAELGASRFPPSEDLYYYYCKHLGVKFSNSFPDPGKVRTGIVCQDVITSFFDGDSTHAAEKPQGFDTMVNSFAGLILGGVFEKGIDPNENPLDAVLPAVGQITQWLSDPQYVQSGQNPDIDCPSTAPLNGDKAQKAWQKYLSAFENQTFYAGLKQLFVNGRIPHPEAPAQNIDVQIWHPDGQGQWQPVPQWREKDIVRFAAMGVGSGTFRPLLQHSFAHVLRMVINGREDHQQIIDDPMGSLAICRELLDGFFFKDVGDLFLDAPVKKIERIGQKIRLTYTRPNIINDSIAEYDQVILAMQTRAIEHLGVTSAPVNALFEPKVNAAINQTHVADASKLFIEVENWWNGVDHPIKQLLTDGFVPQCYTVDSGHMGTLAFLLSYVWADDARQIAYLSNIENFRKMDDPCDRRYGLEMKDVLAARAKFAWFKLYKEALFQTIEKAKSHNNRQVKKADLATFWTHIKPIDFRSAWEADDQTFDEDIVKCFHKHAAMMHWNKNPYQFGACAAAQTGAERHMAATFYDYQKTLQKGDVLLANDSMGFSIGWIEGGIKSAINAVCAIIQKYGRLTPTSGNTPLTISRFRYDYGRWFERSNPVIPPYRRELALAE